MNVSVDISAMSPLTKNAHALIHTQMFQFPAQIVRQGLTEMNG